jgi:uncharacterized RDD family membrane protein YckC
MKLLKILMFNPFVKLYLNSDFWFLRLNKRLKSFILEMWYCLSAFIPFLIILTIPSIIIGDTFSTEFTWTELLQLIPFSLLLITILNKDFFGGQSPVHRKLGYQVVDRKTMKPATGLKCMLRNVTAPMWPIEGIFALAYPKRRLGDFIAGTMLIEVNATNPELILNEIQKVKFDGQTRLTLLFSILWVLTFMIVFNPSMRVW